MGANPSVQLVSHLPATHPRKIEIESAVRTSLDESRAQGPLTVILETAPPGAAAFDVLLKVVTAVAVKTSIIESQHDAHWIHAVLGALIRGSDVREPMAAARDVPSRAGRPQEAGGVRAAPGPRALPPEQYRLLVESSPVMIWRSGRDAKCDYFNETWLAFTGRTFEQEIGDGWAEGVHPDDLDRCVAIYRDHFARRAVFEMEYRLRRQDGIYRYIFDRGVPFVDGSGAFAGFIGSCVDVDERVHAHAMLEAAAVREKKVADGLAAELIAQGKQAERALPPRPAVVAGATTTPPAVLAREKVARVFGASQADTLLRRYLAETGVGALTTMEDLDRFAQALKARGGIDAALGSALSVQMLMNRLQLAR